MEQVKDLLDLIGQAGRNADGSYTRRCYSPEFFQAVGIVEDKMVELGMQVSRDAAGNVRGVLPGTQAGAKSIIIGSHLDTLLSGGKFDGAYGVAAGLAVVEQLRKEKKTLRHPLEVYGFNGEVVSPLGGTFGSRAIAGLVDAHQPGLEDVLEMYGYSVQDILDCERDFSDVKCFLEPHVEQGDLLSNEKLDIGVVNGIAGIVRYKVVAKGQSNHAGTTMMKNRKDALVAMSRLISEADKRCREIDDTLVLTVGTIRLWPGSENIIPERVECTFEMRHMDVAKTDELLHEIRKVAKSIPAVKFEITKTIDKDSVRCDQHIIDVLNEAADEVGTSYAIVPSGAGHDASALAHRVPTGMIFVPSQDGVDHAGRNEWTEPHDLVNGAKVLYCAVQKLDQED